MALSSAGSFCSRSRGSVPALKCWCADDAGAEFLAPNARTPWSAAASAGARPLQAPGSRAICARPGTAPGRPCAWRGSGSTCTNSAAHRSRRSVSSGALTLNSSTSRPLHRRRQRLVGLGRRIDQEEMRCRAPPAPAARRGATSAADLTVMRSSAKSVLSTRVSACASSMPTWAPAKGCSRVLRISRS